MKNLFYASVVGFTLLCGCSGGSNKDISTSEFYWPPAAFTRKGLHNAGVQGPVWFIIKKLLEGISKVTWVNGGVWR